LRLQVEPTKAEEATATTWPSKFDTIYWNLWDSVAVRMGVHCLISDFLFLPFDQIQQFVCRQLLKRRLIALMAC
jgi:hypothetical protein